MAITNKILIAFVFTILCVTSDVHCNTYASPPTHCAPSASPSDDGQEIKCFTYNQCAFWKSGERLCDGMCRRLNQFLYGRCATNNKCCCY
uniref:Knottin scorpion toxin-like domain-containing protein n=2 Tax=Brassica oleracea TaxID=3712 RepID=A0A0D3EAG9_BRAOL|nr:unnamed protein product [Brassica oleracea]